MSRARPIDETLKAIWSAKRKRRSSLAALPLKVKIRQLIELQKIDWAIKPKNHKPRFRPWASA